LFVLVTTNRSDLRYKLELRDTLNLAVLLFEFPIPAPHPFTNFGAYFPGYLLVPDHDYRIRVYVNPADGGTPPHSDDVVYVTTRAVVAWPIMRAD
jgi:hypothetical protein